MQVSRFSKVIFGRFKVLLLVLAVVFTQDVKAGGGGDGDFNAGDMIMHHILDTHEWHVAGDFSIPLPIIIYHKGQGLKMFMSSKFEHGHASYDGYAIDHEKIVAVNAAGEVNEAESANIMDFSITKNVVTLFLVLALVFFVFKAAANGYKKNEGKAPSGVQSFFEPIIVFIRDEVAKPVIGKRYMEFMPYLLSVFFFIWIANLLGLVPFFPGGANLTGNIAVALVLACCSFFIIMKVANKNYWEHIFAMPGVPIWMLVILTPIELIGMFIRPAVLCIRLFANITAGHITILAFVSLIFILRMTMGDGAGWGIAPVSVLLSIFMTAIELLVAFLQAFIFTLLSATYFAAAVEEAHH
jgi:F-type H+-transporting ATPase subunit a